MTAAIIPLPAAADPAASCTPVAGEPTVVRAVRALVGHVPAARIAVVVAEPSVGTVRDVLVSHGCPDVALLALPAAGDRRDAVVAGVDAIVGQSDSASPILVHDVGYPLVPTEVTARVLAGVQAGHRIVLPVLPMTDSVKSVDDRGVVTATVDRSTLLTAQYPRGFAAATLRELGSDDVVDALSARIPVATVAGHADGLRFTVPGDATLLAAIIASRR